MKIFISVLLGCLAAGGVLAAYLLEQAGAQPSDGELRKYASLPYFKDGRFIPPKDMSVRTQAVGGRLGMARFMLASFFTPGVDMPKEPLTRESFGRPADLAVYWLGHSSFILEVAGRRVLADPVFANAAPVPFMFGRYTASPLARKDIPPVDAVLITHNHYDHLERASVRALRADPAVTFIVPSGVGAALRGWGVPAERIRELAWGEAHRLDGLEIIARPASHYTGRRGADKNKTLWNGYVLRGAGKSVYLSGDTGYEEHFFKETGEKYGPFDAAIVEIDAWNAGWPNLHLFPEQAVRAAREVRAREMIPSHWGVFNLARHPWDQSVRETARFAREAGVAFSTPKMGEKFIPGESASSDWWARPAN